MKNKNINNNIKNENSINKKLKFKKVNQKKKTVEQNIFRYFVNSLGSEHFYNVHCYFYLLSSKEKVLSTYNLCANDKTTLFNSLCSIEIDEVISYSVPLKTAITAFSSSIQN